MYPLLLRFSCLSFNKMYNPENVTGYFISDYTGGRCVGENIVPLKKEIVYFRPVPDCLLLSQGFRYSKFSFIIF